MVILSSSLCKVYALFKRKEGSMVKKRTSKRIASLASRVLRDKKSTKKEKFLAGTALCQREKITSNKRKKR